MIFKLKFSKQRFGDQEKKIIARLVQVFFILSPSALTLNKFWTAGSQKEKVLFFSAVRFEPGTAVWEARMLPLYYAAPEVLPSIPTCDIS